MTYLCPALKWAGHIAVSVVINISWIFITGYDMFWGIKNYYETSWTEEGLETYERQEKVTNARRSLWEQQLWSCEEDSRRQKCKERKTLERKCQNLLYSRQLTKKKLFVAMVSIGQLVPTDHIRCVRPMWPPVIIRSVKVVWFVIHSSGGT